MNARPAIRIGYLVQQAPPELGAGPARVEEMGRTWIANGARVSVFTGMPNRPTGVVHEGYRGQLYMTEEREGLQYYRSWLYASPKHGALRTILNNVSFMTTAALNAGTRARTLDVLIASAPPFLPHVAGHVAAVAGRIPLILELRDLWPDYLVDMGMLPNGNVARALFRLERWLLDHAAHVVVVTRSFARRVAEKGVPSERITVIPNGVEPDRYYRSHETPPIESLRRRDHEFLIGYLGNIGAGQGLDAVVRAAAQLSERDQSIRFVIAGDGPERASLAARLDVLRLKNVSLHPPIQKESTRAFYNACDACLVPLAPVRVFQETVPSKLFEVMACEQLVLGCLDGEARDIIERSGGGLVARPGNSDAIVDMVLKARDLSCAERRQMGEQARAFVVQHFSRAAMAERYLDLLRAVAAQ